MIDNNRIQPNPDLSIRLLNVVDKKNCFFFDRFSKITKTIPKLFSIVIELKRVFERWRSKRIHIFDISTSHAKNCRDNNVNCFMCIYTWPCNITYVIVLLLSFDIEWPLAVFIVFVCACVTFVQDIHVPLYRRFKCITHSIPLRAWLPIIVLRVVNIL